MDYLNVDINYFEHVKTVRLVSSLGRAAELLPLKLWAHCAKTRSKDGRLIGYSPEEIETFAGWTGKPGKAVESMLRIGFLEKDGNDYIVHDYAKEQGHLEAFRERASNAAKARWDKYRSNASSNAQALSKQCPNQLTNQPTKEEARQARMLEKLKEVERESRGSN